MIFMFAVVFFSFFPRKVKKKKMPFIVSDTGQKAYGENTKCGKNERR